MNILLVKKYYHLINQQQIIEQAKFTYSPLGKAFEKQIKTIKDQGEKQVEALNTLKSGNKKLTIEDVIPKSAFIDDESKKELDKIKKIEDTIDREKLVYKACRNTDDFRKFQTIRTFGKDIYNGITILEEADKNQSDLLNEIKHFNDKTRTKNYKRKQEKEVTLDSLHIFLKQEKWYLMALKAKYFQINLKDQVF